MRRALPSARVRIILGILAVVVVGWSGSAAAEKKRVGVPRFDGPQEAVVRKAVMQVLKGDGYDVVGAKEIDGAAKSTGGQLDSNDGFKAVAKELSISAFVTGEVSKKKAKLTIRNGADGSVSGEGSFGGATPAKIAADVRDGFARRLGSAVERGRAPSGAKKPAAPPVAEADDSDDNAGAAGGDEAPSKPAAKPASSSSSSSSSSPSSSSTSEAKDETPPPSSGSGSGPEETLARKAPEPEGEPLMGPRALDFRAALGGFSRSLSYNQLVPATLAPGARAYNLALGPVLSLRLVTYPFAFVTSSFAANIGIEVAADESFAISGSTSAGGTLGTTVHDRYIGGRLRLMVGGVHEIAVFGGGGEHAFAFVDGPGGMGTPDDRMQVYIPDTIYRYARGGIDAKFELPSGLTARVAGAYRYVLNGGGQISTPPFFPFLGVAGVDLEGELGYHVTPSIEARIGVNLKRYFYAMNSSTYDLNGGPMSPSCPCNAAGGAVDQYLGFTIGAAYVFGGVTPSASSPSDDSPPAPKKKKHKKKKSDDDGEASDASGGDSGGGDSGGDSDEQ
jgi:hypothetical protein